MAPARLPTARVTVTSDAVRELGLLDVAASDVDDLGLPLVAKPARGGSALGIRLARTAEDVPAALLGAFAHDREALLERLVDGRDLAVSVVERAGGVLALPVVEARPREREFYDFEARYTPGQTEFDAPADLPDDVADEARRLAVRAYEALGCSGPARVDLMLGEDGLTLLELNPVPGFTETSLLPLAAEAAGLSLRRSWRTRSARPGCTRATADVPRPTWPCVRLELAALAALAYWGAVTPDSTVLKVVLAIGAPLLAALVWGTFVSPKARFEVAPHWRMLRCWSSARPRPRSTPAARACWATC